MITRRIALATLAGAFTSIHTARTFAAEPIRIAFVGDSMADGVWGGVQRRISKNPCLKQTLRTGRFGEIGTGLARADKFNWPAKVKTILTDFKPNLFVVSFGLNDRNPVVDISGKNRVDLTAPNWTAAYKDQVSAFLQSAASTHASILWLGIPVLRDDASNKDALEKNIIFKEAINEMKQERVTYVAPWTLSTSGEETFQPYYTDASGSRVQLRASDGIHFTGAGYDLIAAYVWTKITDHLERHGGAVSAVSETGCK